MSPTEAYNDISKQEILLGISTSVRYAYLTHTIFTFEHTLCKTWLAFVCFGCCCCCCCHTTRYLIIEYIPAHLDLENAILFFIFVSGFKVFCQREQTHTRSLARSHNTRQMLYASQRRQMIYGLRKTCFHWFSFRFGFVFEHSVSGEQRQCFIFNITLQQIAS